MTREDWMFIAVATANVDGNTQQYRDAVWQRSFVLEWECYCDSIYCVLDRAMFLVRVWEKEDKEKV